MAHVSGIHSFRLETPHHSIHFPDITPSYEGSLLWCVTSLRSRRERSQTLVLSQRSLGRNSLLILASAYHSLRWRAGEAGTRGGTTCGGVLVNAYHIVSRTVTTPGGAIAFFFRPGLRRMCLPQDIQDTFTWCSTRTTGCGQPNYLTSPPPRRPLLTTPALPCRFVILKRERHSALASEFHLRSKHNAMAVKAYTLERRRSCQSFPGVTLFWPCLAGGVAVTADTEVPTAHKRPMDGKYM